MPVALIYGPAGSGKTVNSCRLKGNTLLLNSDYSSVVLQNFPDIHVTVETVEHWCDKDNAGKPYTTWFRKQFEDAASSGKYENIVVDNLTDMFSLGLEEYRKSGKYKDERRIYFILYQQIRELVRQANRYKCNILFTAWETVDTIPSENGDIQRIRPNISMTIMDNVMGLCQMVGHVEHATGKDSKEHWYYNTNGNRQLLVKDQLYLRKAVMPESVFVKVVA